MHTCIVKGIVLFGLVLVGTLFHKLLNTAIYAQIDPF